MTRPAGARHRPAPAGAPAPDEYGPGGYRQVQGVFVTVDVRHRNEEPPNDDHMGALG